MWPELISYSALRHGQNGRCQFLFYAGELVVSDPWVYGEGSGLNPYSKLATLFLIEVLEWNHVKSIGVQLDLRVSRCLNGGLHLSIYELSLCAERLEHEGAAEAGSGLAATERALQAQFVAMMQEAHRLRAKLFQQGARAQVRSGFHEAMYFGSQAHDGPLGSNRSRQNSIFLTRRIRHF